MAEYVHKINNKDIAASQVVPQSPLDLRIAAIEEFSDLGAFEIVDSLTGEPPHPDVDDPSNKVIYLYKDPNLSVEDPYTEWIAIITEEGQTRQIDWEIIGTTAMKFQDATTSQKGVTQLNSTTVISNELSTNETMAVTAMGVKNAIESLDATVNSTGGTSVSVQVVETDGKVSAVTVSDNIVDEWQVTPDDTHYPSEKLVKDELDKKADKIDMTGQGDPTGNLPEIDSTGDLTDSGIAADDVVTDVKIGNTSLVTNHVATIPQATAAAGTESALGVVTITTMNIPAE